MRYVLSVASPSQDGATYAIDHGDPSEYFLSYEHRKARYKSAQFRKKVRRVKSDGTCRFRWALICPNRFSALSSLLDVCVCVCFVEWLRTLAWPQNLSSERKDRRGALNANSAFTLFKKRNLSVIDSDLTSLCSPATAAHLCSQYVWWCIRRMIFVGIVASQCKLGDFRA